MVAELERRTREYFEDDPAPTPVDYAEALVSAGGSIQAIADDLTTALGFHVDRETVRRYLYSLAPEDAVVRFTRAREAGAHAKAEQSQAIADATAADTGAVAKARIQIATRQWTAEKWNPAAFSTPKGATVTVNIGQLHLDALRARHAEILSASAESAEKVTGTLKMPTDNAPITALRSS